jgi:hypothetical protein
MSVRWLRNGPGAPNTPRAPVSDDTPLCETSDEVTGLAATMPATRPTTQPSNVKVTASVVNCAMIRPFEAPIAFRIPISRLRSLTIITMTRRRITTAAPTAPARL